jgi:hypothetical protein
VSERAEYIARMSVSAVAGIELKGQIVNWIRLSVLLLMGALLATVGEAQKTKIPPPREQSVFSSEDDGVQRPVSLPEGVAQVLRNDTHVLAALNADKISPDQLPTGWFSASEIHLNGPDEVDLIVEGEGHMRGAHVNPFWVFRKTPQGYRLVLNESADLLEVLNTKWKGYRKIRLSAVIARTVVRLFYRFEGHEYRLYQRKYEPISWSARCPGRRSCVWGHLTGAKNTP